jgi:3-oxoacyl-[acyl-carrier protein] reductase
MFSTSIQGVFFTLRKPPSRARRRTTRRFDGPKMMGPNSALYLRAQAGVSGSVTIGAVGPRNVTVHVLSPGFTETDMLPEQYREYGASLSPFNRVGTAKEVADVAAFLASDAARWVTGQNVQAGGGVV